MKLTEIEARIKEIKEKLWDDEVAHSLEDDLREDFIGSLVTRKDNIGKQAKLILTTNLLDFSRWCA